MTDLSPVSGLTEKTKEKKKSGYLGTRIETGANLYKTINPNCINKNIEHPFV